MSLVAGGLPARLAALAALAALAVLAAGCAWPGAASCPDGLDRCRAAAGVIVYVEAVDPDGDGDAHFVVAGAEGITAPGLTAIDVARDLRPRPLPRVGEWLSAAGPVQRGSFGQAQIEAVDVRAAGG